MHRTCRPQVGSSSRAASIYRPEMNWWSDAYRERMRDLRVHIVQTSQSFCRVAACRLEGRSAIRRLALEPDIRKHIRKSGAYEREGHQGAPNISRLGTNRG